MTAPEMGLALHELGKSYGRRVVLDGVSHRFAPGLTLLTGPSGAGKSTLLRLIATAERPSRGRSAGRAHGLGAAFCRERRCATIAARLAMRRRRSTCPKT
ncbi:ATP-binding cassette domain-containing protein [Sphingomonas changnyeongensis]|uniref:ATP-binding cassette domain-containing protein n=1 Tax=Sphingomonas changnyeongensis TaxID=2698679 RepID=A0A7Z2NYA5_9SPHN|nr:ATP-binding cassette domain-containing protein [Sphingomonas changnyeongensis]